MRRFPVLVAFFCSIALILGLTACGGSTPAANVPASITFTPASISLNRGDVYQTSAIPYDKGGTTQIAADLTYTSSNSDLVSVSTAGNLCAGKWDATFVVCTPATTDGTATITVKATSYPSVTATSSVTVHQKVDRVQLNNLGSTCLSSTKTQQLSAIALSTNQAYCTSLGASAPCTIPSSTLGQFTFTTSDPGILSIDTVTTPGLATANAPGQTNVIASISGVNSAAQPFQVCPIVQISYLNGDTKDTAPFTLAKAGTKSMLVTAVDSVGFTLTNPPVSYISHNSYALSIAASTTAGAATVTASNSGTQSFTFAECAPPSCNKNLTPVYSTGILGIVSGTYNAPTVYAGSTSSLSLYPIDTSNNTVGTVITLPYLPNSFKLNPQGTHGLLGSDSNPLMILTTASNTVTVFNTLTGAKVLAISPDGSYGLASNSTGTYVINLAAGTAPVSANIGKALKGTFTPDSRYAYFTTGTSTLYALDLTSGVTLTYNESSAIKDVSVLANNSITYLAQGTSVNAVGNCNLQSPGYVDTQTGTAPSALVSLPNGTGTVALDGSSLLLIHQTTATQACPPTVSETSSSIPFTFASGTPSQLLVTTDASKAVVTSTGTQVAVVTLPGTAKTVTLGASANVLGTGDITADSATMYIGGSDNAVHKIDLVSGADAAQIAVTLKDANSAVVAPNLVAVRNK